MRGDSAVWKALPRARKVSSVVWWSSTATAVSFVDLGGGAAKKRYMNEGNGASVLAKSPLHRTLKLQPACFAQACSR